MKLKIIVRLKTESYYDNNKVVMKKVLTVLKRKSVGNFGDVLIDACDINNITNLLELEDGVYEISWNVTSTDWETGQADDWNYMLVPYSEET